jgi:hypothetical protein
MEKPQFILEIEATTGLRCEFDATNEWQSRWWLLSPTGVKLCHVSGADDMVGGIGVPDMYVLQGLDSRARMRRRHAAAEAFAEGQRRGR